MKKYALMFSLMVVALCGKDFKLGVENLSFDTIQKIKPLRIGLITNQTSKDQQGKRTVDILQKQGLSINFLMTPEHGLEGNIAAEKEIKDSIDTATGIPVISLYGKGTGKKINKSSMAMIDMMIFDIQDVGMRHYTYISTLFHALQAAAEHNKKFLLLDRPNPLGRCMEGPLVDKTLHSFISIASIPVRHGMTFGELARYFNENYFNNKVSLQVVPMRHYYRSTQLPSTLCLTLSPYIQNKASCNGYSFLGLLGEIRPFDVGLGTEKPFQCIALPHTSSLSKSQWQELGMVLKQYAIQSSLHTYYNAHKKH